MGFVKKQLLAGCTLAGLLLLAMPAAVQAAPSSAAAGGSTDGFNLTLSPLPTNLVTAPGQTVSTPIRVSNSGTKAVRIKASVMKFKADDNTGRPVLVEPTANDAYIKWASLSQSSFLAQPGVYNTVTATIKVPKTAAFGYYYAIVFSEENADPAQARTAKVNGAVASLILLDVQAPGEKRILEVASFKSTHRVYQYLPARFEITVRNTGNVHAIPTGNVFVGRTAAGNFLGTLRINEGQGNVLPKSSRQFYVDWGDGFPNYQQQRQNGQVVSDKDGKPVEKLSWSLGNADKVRFGRYVASMTLVYNDGKRDVPINGQVTFWVIPWLPILIILVVLALVIFALYSLLRSGVTKVKRTRQKQSS